jgi:hypothetical protein
MTISSLQTFRCHNAHQLIRIISESTASLYYFFFYMMSTGTRSDINCGKMLVNSFLHPTISEFSASKCVCSVCVRSMQKRVVVKFCVEKKTAFFLSVSGPLNSFCWDTKNVICTHAHQKTSHFSSFFPILIKGAVNQRISIFNFTNY